jgi:hypothetical protein
MYEKTYAERKMTIFVMQKIVKKTFKNKLILETQERWYGNAR